MSEHTPDHADEMLSVVQQRVARITGDYEVGHLWRLAESLNDIRDALLFLDAPEAHRVAVDLVPLRDLLRDAVDQRAPVER